MKSFLLFLGVLFLSGLALAQTSTTLLDPAIQPPSSDEVSAFFSSLKGLTGPLAIAAAVVQGLMLVIRKYIDLGNYKLLVVLFLSTVFGILSLRIAGVPLSEAMLHAQTLAAFQVLFHQIYVQFVKPDAVPTMAVKS